MKRKRVEVKNVTRIIKDYYEYEKRQRAYFITALLLVGIISLLMY